MDFAQVVDRVRLNLGIGDEELCRGLGIGRVTLENYLSGYVTPVPAVLQRMFSNFSVIAEEEPKLPRRMEVPGSLDVEELIEKICTGKRFAVPVKDDSLADRRIFSGSHAVVESGGRIKNGDVVLAELNGGESGLYVYDEDADGVMLSGEYVKDFRIVGPVVAALEKIGEND